MKDEFLRDQGYETLSPDAETAEATVKRVLGEDFSVEYDDLPPNVGVKGDGRHFGDTVMITTDFRVSS